MRSDGYRVLEIMDTTKRRPASRALRGLIVSGDPAPGNRIKILAVVPRNRYGQVAELGRFLGRPPTLGPDEPITVPSKPSTKAPVWTFVLKPRTDLAQFQRFLAAAGYHVTVMGLRHVRRTIRNREAHDSRSEITIQLTGRGLTSERRSALRRFGRFQL
jgi:hypothetical protein